MRAGSRRVPGMLCALSTPRISLVELKPHVSTPCWPWSVVAGTGSGAVGGYREGWYTGYLGGCYTGYYPPRHPPGTTLVLPGPNHCQECPSTVSPRALQPLQGLRTPWAPAPVGYPPQDQYGRDSRYNILKLVKTAECRLKCVMRPGIVPVSETG